MSKKLLMNNYSSNGLMPVMDGLICWLDGRDLESTEDGTVWIDRSGNGNNAILKRKDAKTTPVIENGFYRTYTSGYVLLPTMNFNSKDGISVYLDTVMNDAPKQNYSRIYTIGYLTTSTGQLTIPNGHDSFASGKPRFFSNLLKDKIIPNFYANQPIRVSMMYDESISIAINHIDNIILSDISAKIFNTTFSNSYLNAESPTVINIQDMSYGLILIYNRKLSEEEMKLNDLYSQSIERGE